MPEKNRYLATLRQHCAEGRVSDATRLYNRWIDDHPDPPAKLWRSHLMMGREAEPAEILKALDDDGDMSTLAGDS